MRIIYSFIKKIIEYKSKDKKDETIMDNNISIGLKQKISSSDFNKHKTALEIKRIGKQNVIVNANGAIPVTKENINRLGTEFLQHNKAIKIKTVGLSRAQVGRIVSDLRETIPHSVYVRRVPVRQVPMGTSFRERTVRTKLMNHEILVVEEDGNI